MPETLADGRHAPLHEASDFGTRVVHKGRAVPQPLSVELVT